MVKKTLGEIIKETMKEKGINSSAVARKMNVSRQAISQINLRKKFDLEFLQRLKEASGLDFTSIAYEKFADNSAPPASDEQQTNLTEGITINIRITTKDKEKLDNLPSFIEEVEESGKRYGFELT
ncbi:helix-turn-helix domain-containing protein [Parapedobacter sp.]